MISETKRISLIGNTFHCVVVAYLLASWAVGAGYLSSRPGVAVLWEKALRESYRGRPGTVTRIDREQRDEFEQWRGELVDNCRATVDSFRDPGNHELNPGDPDYLDWRAETLNVIGADSEETLDPREERVDALEVSIRRNKARQRNPNITVPEEFGDRILHLVQDEDVVEQIQTQVLPPDEYYEALAKNGRNGGQKLI